MRAILAIYDQELERQLDEQLSVLGFTVVASENLNAETARDVDLICVQLPEGAQSCAEIRGMLGDHGPMLLGVLPPGTTRKTVREALQLGVDDYVVSPVRLDDLDGRLVLAERHRRLILERRATAHLRGLLRRATDVIWRLDLSSLRFAYVSPSITRLTGHSQNEVLSKTLQDCLSLESAARFMAAIGEETERLQNLGVHYPRVVEVEWGHKDGTSRWVRTHARLICDRQGAPIGVEGVAHDISERRRTEMALKQSEERYRRLLDVAPVGIVAVSPDRIAFANPAAATIMGVMSPALLVGEPIADYFDGQAAHFGREMDTPLHSTSEETIRRPDGVIVTVECNRTDIVHDNEPMELIVFNDISQRRRLESQLILADQMASVGTVAASVAHEINNPLAYIMANLEFLHEEVTRRLQHDPGLREMAEALLETREGARRVRTIVRDLKTVSRRSENVTEVVDVRTILDSSLKIVWNEIRHRAELRTHYETCPLVNVNPARLGQVVLNLLVNAAHAIGEVDRRPNHITLRTSTSETGSCLIEVVDTGCGIEDTLLKTIFDPFFTTKPEGIGTGLGLSICRDIVAEMRGEISIQSQAGKGTVVRVELPAASNMRATPRTLRATPPLRTSSARVLVVDDEPSIANCIRRALKHCDVTTVNSGQDALDHLVEKNFDIVFCDLMMPDMTGMDVFDAVRVTSPDHLDRFVFMTGGAFTPRARDFLKRVENHLLEKPFDVAMIRDLVDASDVC